jgi:hypothetical protein
LRRGVLKQASPAVRGKCLAQPVHIPRMPLLPLSAIHVGIWVVDLISRKLQSLGFSGLLRAVQRGQELELGTPDGRSSQGATFRRYRYFETALIIWTMLHRYCGQMLYTELFSCRLPCSEWHLAADISQMCLACLIYTRPYS